MLNNFIRVLKKKPPGQQAVNFSSCPEGEMERKKRKASSLGKQLHGGEECIKED